MLLIFKDLYKDLKEIEFLELYFLYRLLAFLSLPLDCAL